MIEAGWDEYRGWAARARELQTHLRRWNRASLISAVAAALFGGLAVQLSDLPAWSKWAAIAAAVAAALSPVIGHQMLSSAVERKWLKARALAESIKSECFRVAACLSPYGATDAVERFVDWRMEVTAAAVGEGLTGLLAPCPPAGDRRRPPPGFDLAWYLENRLRDQKEYYASRQRLNERIAARLRALNIASTLLAAGFAAVGVVHVGVTAWVGVCVTIATAIMAVGLLDKRHSLAAQYGAMAIALGRIEEWQAAGGHGVAELVDRTESLLAAEHAAWTETLGKVDRRAAEGKTARP